jgi:hypothetical protein
VCFCSHGSVSCPGGSDTTYSVVGIGDYFGNNTSDILFRNSAGDTWVEQITNGAFALWSHIGDSNTSYSVPITGGIEIGRGPNGEELPHIQVSAEALTDVSIYDCVPSIVRIEHRSDRKKEFSEVWAESRAIDFTWKHSTLSKGNPLRFNILAYDPRAPGLFDVVPPDKRSNMLKQFYEATGRNGEYRYTVHVAGRDVVMSMARIYVEWVPNTYPLITLEPIEASQNMEPI